MLTNLGMTAGLAIAPMVALVSPLGAAAEPVAPQPAEWLPSDAAYTLMIDTRSTTWAPLNQYAFFEQLTTLGGVAPNPGLLPFWPDGLSYEADIAPWVGDTTAIALLPLDRPRPKVLAEHEIFVAPIADPDAFATLSGVGFVNRVTALRGSEPETQTSQTIDILYWPPQFEAEEDDAASSGPALEGLKQSRLRRDWQQGNWTAASVTRLAASNTSTTLSAELEEDINMKAPPVPPAPSMSGLAIAIFPDFIIIAEHPAAIRAWIDQRPTAAADALAANEQFRRILSHPQYDDALGFVYADLSEILPYALTNLPFSDVPLPLPLPSDLGPENLSQWANLELDGSLELLIYPQGRGLRLQGRGYYDPALLPTVPPPASPDVLNQVPGNSYGTISGQDIAGAWQGLTNRLEVSEAARPFLAQARGAVAAFTGLDLDEDIFGWMDQGFSIFLYPTDDTPLTTLFPELRIGLGMVLQTSDRATAEATFTALDDWLGAGPVTVESRALDAQQLTGWSTDLDGDGQPDSLMGRGWVDEDTLVITSSLDAAVDLLSLEPTNAILNNFRFAASTHDFPIANQGYGFVNGAPVRSLLNSLLWPNPDEPGALPFSRLAASLQALSGTLSFTEEYAQLDAMLLLAPAEASE